MDNTEILTVAERKDVASMQGDPVKFIRDIDEYLGQTFDMMTQIDEAYGKVSTYFIDHANLVVGDRDYERLSTEEQTLANVYMVAALAVSGANAVIRGIKETIVLEKVKRLHRKVATAKYESLGRMIDRAQRNHDDAAAVLARHNSIPFKTADIRVNFQGFANMLEEELCQYRDIRFRLDMLLWLKEEYEAWLDDRLYSDTPMPTMGQASVAAIYVLNNQEAPYSRDKREAGIRDFGQRLADSLQLSGTANGKQFITAFELLAIIDTQLSAVLEHGYLDKDPLANASNKDTEDDMDIDIDKLSCKPLFTSLCLNAEDGTLIDQMLSKNPITKDSVEVSTAFLNMRDDYNHGETRVSISGFLLIAAAVMPIWNLDWAWYWCLALSVVAAIAVAKFFPYRSLNRMNVNFVNKFHMMSCNYEHYMAKEAGLIEPKSKIREMAKSRNGFWIGLIIGGILGAFFTPIGMIIGAIIGAILGGGSSDDIDTHGEGWQEIKICSPAKQWITIVIAAILVLFEIYSIFIK